MVVQGARDDLVTVVVQPQSGYYAKVTFSPDSVKTTYIALSDGVTHTFRVPAEDAKVTVEFIKGNQIIR